MTWRIPHHWDQDMGFGVALQTCEPFSCEGLPKQHFQPILQVKTLSSNTGLVLGAPAPRCPEPGGDTDTLALPSRCAHYINRGLSVR